MAQEFPKFILLPPEIRNMVWEYALPEPRVYEVMDVPHAKQKMNAADGLMFANVHHEPPPALGAVCREARGFALHHYKPLTLGRTTKYVDLSRDLLLLEPYLLLKRLHRTLHFMSRIPLIRDQMAGLALGTSYGSYSGICHPVMNYRVSRSNMSKLLTGLAKFPKLKTLLFVVHQEFQFEFDYCCPLNLSATRTAPLPPPMPSQPPHLSQSPPGQGIYSAQQAPPMYSSPSPSSSVSSSPSPLPSPMVAHHHYPPANLGYSPQPPSRLPTQLPLPPVPAYLPSPILHASGAVQTPPHSPYSPPLIHQAQAMPAPQPPAPQSLRPQVVHQAYRFKFDIEGNINRHPRRPHLNQLLFYPLDNTAGEADDKDDWEGLLNAFSNAELDEMTDDHGDFSDPWPTNDDWRRFRSRFQREVVAALRSGLVKGEGQNAFCVDANVTATSGRAGCESGTIRNNGSGLYSTSDKKYQQYLQQNPQMRDDNGDDYSSGYNGPQDYNSIHSLHGTKSFSGVQKSGGPGGRRGRYSLKHNLPAIKGASLLWRYTRGQ